MEGFIEIEKYQKLQQEFTVLQSSFEQQKFQLEQLKRMIFWRKERAIYFQSVARAIESICYGRRAS